VIRGASEEISEAQYCASGNHQDWLVKCAKKKIRDNRVMAVTEDEWIAYYAEIRSFRESLGGSDVGF